MIESIEELRKICQTIDKYESYSTLTQKYFARKISIYITKILLYTPITANQATLIAFAIAFLSGILLASGTYLHMLVGALLLELYYVFDNVDGEIARYRGSSSLTGAYIDRVMNYIVHPLILASLTMGVYTFISDPSFLIFGFMATIGVILIDLVEDVICKVVVMTRMSYLPEPQTKVSTRKVAFSLFERFPWLNHIKPIARITPYTVPGLIHVILLASLLDFLQATFGVTILISFIYYLILVYGTVVNVIWASLIILYIRGLQTEGLYKKLFRSNSK